ncbi:MAG: XisI protein [Caldilineaceae bacterium]
MVRTVENYRQIVKQLLTIYSQIPYVHDDLFDETIFDDESGRYLLVTMGWQGSKRINTIVLHLDLRDDKVWIQCNNTDQDIVQELVQSGIAPADIAIPVSTKSHMERQEASVLGAV